MGGHNLQHLVISGVCGGDVELVLLSFLQQECEVMFLQDNGCQHDTHVTQQAQKQVCQTRAN